MPILQVVDGALLNCSFGTAPTVLKVTSNPFVKIGGRLVATILDMNGMTNIPSFVGCLSPENPMFVAAVVTAGLAAPPCMPSILAPWAMPSVINTINGIPVLLQTATCFCKMAGVIMVSNPGQLTTLVTSI